MDPFEEIQNMILRVLPIVLIGPGIILVSGGLFMWLGGLRWLKSVGAFSAAVTGLLCAWFLMQRQLVSLVLFPVILAGAGVYFNKVVVVFLGAAAAAAMVLFVPAIAGVGGEPAPARSQPAGEQRLNLLESVEWVQEKIEQARQDIKTMVVEIPKSRKLLAIGAAVLVAVMGIFSWRLVCAATCSVIGVVLITCGMVILLLYKGAAPMTLLMERRLFWGLIMAGMVAAGLLVQLWLCPAKSKKISKTDIKKEILNPGDKK